MKPRWRLLINWLHLLLANICEGAGLLVCICAAKSKSKKAKAKEKLVCFFCFVDYEQWSAGESALVPLLNTMGVVDMIGIDFGAA